MEQKINEYDTPSGERVEIIESKNVLCIRLQRDTIKDNFLRFIISIKKWGERKYREAFGDMEEADFFPPINFLS